MDTNKNPPYMFSRPMTDYFFRWRWWSAPIIFLPLAFLLMFYAIMSLAISLIYLFGLVVLGFLLWTFFEYCMHRFMFHFVSKSPILEHMHYVVHGMHHAHPTDPVRVIFPPFGSMVIGGIMGVIIFLLLPITWATGIFAGFISGYVWYEFMHYAAHHIKWKTRMFKRLKRHHLLHHHHMASRAKNFGVSTALWDRIFNTYLV